MASAINGVKATQVADCGMSGDALEKQRREELVLSMTELWWFVCLQETNGSRNGVRRNQACHLLQCSRSGRMMD